MLGVVVYVVHIRLFVGTQQRTHRVFQRCTAVFQVFQRIQAQDAGAFIVGHAAAQQPAIPHADGVGVSVPAIALGHNVGVGDGGKELLAVGNLAGLGPADVAVGVEGVQAQFIGDFQRLGQRGLGAGAEWCARLGCALDTGDCHQAGNVTQDVVAVAFHKGVNRRPARIVHVHKSFLLSFFFQYTTLAEFVNGKLDRDDDICRPANIHRILPSPPISAVISSMRLFSRFMDVSSRISESKYEIRMGGTRNIQKMARPPGQRTSSKAPSFKKQFSL